MNRYQATSLMICVSLVFLAGCTTASPTTPSPTDTSQNIRPQRMADINGTVKEVIGNEFTIETINRSTDSSHESGSIARQPNNTTTHTIMIPVGVPIYIRQGGGGGTMRTGGIAGGGMMGNRGGMMGNRGGTTNGGLAGSLGSNSSAASRPTRAGSGSTTIGSGTLGSITDIKEGSQLQIRLATGGDDQRLIATRVFASSSSNQSSSRSSTTNSSQQSGPPPM